MKFVKMGAGIVVVLLMAACGKAAAPETAQNAAAPETATDSDTAAAPAPDGAAAEAAKVDGATASAGLSCATMQCPSGQLCVETDGPAECVEADVVEKVSESEGKYTITLAGNDEFSVSTAEYEELVAIDPSAQIVQETSQKKFGLPSIRLTPKKKCYCFKCGGDGNKIRTGCSRLGKEKAALDASINCGINRNAAYFHTGKC